MPTKIADVESNSPVKTNPNTTAVPVKTNPNSTASADKRPNSGADKKPGSGSIYSTTRQISVKEAKDKPKLTKRTSSKLEQLSVHDPKEPEDETLFMGHCTRLRHNTCFKVCVFLVVLGLDSADLIADWLLFRDVYMVKPGLVYGPPEDAIVYALLAFSIIGSLTFIFEIVNLWWEIFRENPWINADLASAITLWVEDVPQIVLNVLIVVCRDEAISYFQLVKASIMIIGVVIRIVVCLIRYCSKASLSELHKTNKESRLHVFYRFVIMIGLMCVFGCSLAVFFLTQFERTQDGAIKFHIPRTAFEGEFDEDKYFTNVSVYLNHPLFNFEAITDETTDANWMRLISIYDVKAKQSEIFKLEFDDATKTKFVLYQTDTTGALAISDCYTLDRAAKSVVHETNCATLITGNKAVFLFEFKFVPESIPNLIFGDILYNAVVREAGGVCHAPATSLKTQLSDLHDNGHAAIHYYRTDSVTSDHHLLWTGGANSAQFYHNEGDLIDITKVWQTGFGYCTTTGSLAPHIDTNINVNCNL